MSLVLVNISGAFLERGGRAVLSSCPPHPHRRAASQSGFPRQVLIGALTPSYVSGLCPHSSPNPAFCALHTSLPSRTRPTVPCPFPCRWPEWSCGRGYGLCCCCCSCCCSSCCPPCGSAAPVPNTSSRWPSTMAGSSSWLCSPSLCVLCEDATLRT